MNSTYACLAEQRKQWRKNPSFGFVAKPRKKDDGTLDLLIWDCIIPGKKETPWEGGQYKLQIIFSKNHPSEHPSCRFVPPIFHPNIYSSGSVCLSILGVEWHSSITVKNILLGIQDLLVNPNINSVANYEAYRMFLENRTKYEDTIRHQSKL